MQSKSVALGERQSVTQSLVLDYISNYTCNC